MTGDCEEIRMIFGVLVRFASFRRPGAYLIDVLPEVDWLPFYDWFSNWKKEGDRIHKEDTAVFAYFWNKLKKEIVEGTAPYCWGALFAQSDYAKYGIDELQALYAAYALVDVLDSDGLGDR
jgi:hypothetical protein